MENYNSYDPFTNEDTKKDSLRNFNSSVYNNFEKSLADDYETPRWLLTHIVKFFNAKVDIAGDSLNSKIPNSPLYGQGFNALDEDWGKFKGVKFCYPPFAKPYFRLFIEKAYAEWIKGESSVVIAPLKTIVVDYYQRIRAPKVFIIYPRVNFIFNGAEVGYADSICLLHYDANNKSSDTDFVFWDLKNLNRPIDFNKPIGF